MLIFDYTLEGELSITRPARLNPVPRFMDRGSNSGSERLVTSVEWNLPLAGHGRGIFIKSFCYSYIKKK